MMQCTKENNRHSEWIAHFVFTDHTHYSICTSFTNHSPSCVRCSNTIHSTFVQYLLTVHSLFVPRSRGKVERFKDCSSHIKDMAFIRSLTGSKDNKRPCLHFFHVSSWWLSCPLLMCKIPAVCWTREHKQEVLS